MSKQCQFCELLEWKKSREDEELPSEYTVALVDESYYNGYPSGKITHYGYKLNFCPECGKPMIEEKKHPCDGCNVGWGSVSCNGLVTCHDTCEKLAKYTKN